MKPDLTYEQCERLKQWGLDQTVREGDWIYWPDPYTSDWQKTLVTEILLTHSRELVKLGNYVKLPSAEQMIEELGRHFDALHRAVGGQQFIAWGIVAPDPSPPEPRDPAEELDCYRNVTGKTPRQALYGLCEKIFEKK